MLSRIAWYCLWVLMFVVPFEDMVVIPGWGTISRPVGIAAVLTGLLAVGTTRRIRKPHFLHLLALLVVCWMVLTLGWSWDGAETTERVVTSIQLVFFGWLIWECARSEERIAALFQAYVLGATISSFAVLAAVVANVNSGYGRYSAGGFDPNDVALIIALGIPLAGFLSGNVRGVLRLVNLAYLGLAPAAVLATASRGSFVAALAGTGFVVAYHFTGSWKQRLLLVMGAVLAVALAAGYVPETSWERLSTMGQEVSGGSMSERREIWTAGFALFERHPIQGVGVGAFPRALSTVFGQPKVAHNTFLSVLFEQGVVGIALFALVYVAAARRVLRLPRAERFTWLGVLSAWTLGAAGLSWEHRKPTWVLFSLFIAHLALVARRAPASSFPAAGEEFGDARPIGVGRQSRRSTT